MSDVWFLQPNTAVSLRPGLLTAKGGRSAQTLLGPNRNFYLAIGRAKLKGSAKVAFSVANSEIRWAELVPSRTVLTLSVQNGPACSKSALEKVGPNWPLGSIWLFSFYSVDKQSEFLSFPTIYCGKTRVDNHLIIF